MIWIAIAIVVAAWLLSDGLKKQGDKSKQAVAIDQAIYLPGSTEFRLIKAYVDWQDSLLKVRQIKELTKGMVSRQLEAKLLTMEEKSLLLENRYQSLSDKTGFMATDIPTRDWPLRMKHRWLYINASKDL